MYDYIIITHIPAFYKVNLYNELAKKLNIYVIFIADNTNEKRADDFVSIDAIDFSYEILGAGDFQSRNKFENIKKITNILKYKKYKKVLVGGWDLLEFWFLIFINSKNKNCLALESTVIESKTNGINGLIKKIFLSRISTVYASGELHVKLLNKLNYKGHIKITKGVGIINKPEFEKKDKSYQKRFLYIGRLSSVKNLKFLINIFNNLPDHKLTIIGDGEEREELKTLANKNIEFFGPIENKQLKYKFLENDIFILPSISEPWGLVVEEALYFRIPVVVSENCGSHELVKNDQNGYIVNPKDSQSLKNVLVSIDSEKYMQLLEGVEKFSINKKDMMQIKSYL